MAPVSVEAAQLAPLLLVQARGLEGRARAVQVDEVGRLAVVELLVVLARVQRVQAVGLRAHGRVGVLELVVEGLVVQGRVLVVGREVGRRELRPRRRRVGERRRGGVGDRGVGHRLQTAELHEPVAVGTVVTYLEEKKETERNEQCHLASAGVSSLPPKHTPNSS